MTIMMLTRIQNVPSQTINNQKLTTFLHNLSEANKVFFTYDADLLANTYVDTSDLHDKTLDDIIINLRVQTHLNFDNLGNNYYVIYNNNTEKGKAAVAFAKQKLNATIASISDSNSNAKRIIRGKVIDQFEQPIAGANITESITTNGCFTDKNGYFSLATLSSGASKLIVSHIGFQSKTISLETRNEITITLEAGGALNEVQIVGSRNNNRSSLDTPAPIDIIPLEHVTNTTGQIEINQILQYVIPSFNASKQSGADGADHVVPATLRGLGPDQTLVLINGKRRHQSSLINIYGTRGRGNTGTDLNAIPASAIKTIEVLRDGASAQYGSDAIAGVINIVLKEDVNTFRSNLTYGFYNANTRGDFARSNSGVDGMTMKLSGNYGIKLPKNGL